MSNNKGEVRMSCKKASMKFKIRKKGGRKNIHKKDIRKGKDMQKSLSDGKISREKRVRQGKIFATNAMRAGKADTRKPSGREKISKG